MSHIGKHPAGPQLKKEESNFFVFESAEWPRAWSRPARLFFAQSQYDLVGLGEINRELAMQANDNSELLLSEEGVESLSEQDSSSLLLRAQSYLESYGAAVRADVERERVRQQVLS